MSISSFEALNRAIDQLNEKSGIAVVELVPPLRVAKGFSVFLVAQDHVLCAFSTHENALRFIADNPDLALSEENIEEHFLDELAGYGVSSMGYRPA